MTLYQYAEWYMALFSTHCITCLKKGSGHCIMNQATCMNNASVYELHLLHVHSYTCKLLNNIVHCEWDTVDWDIFADKIFRL